MVFVPPDRTERREAVSRLVATTVVVVAALLCLAIVAFSGDGGPTRIAVVHKPIPAGTSATPASDTSPSAALVPVRTFAQLRARFPVPAHASSTAATPATWRVDDTVAAVRRFYARMLTALGVTWRPAATSAGTRTWSGPVRAASGTRLARLTVRGAASGATTIVLSR